MTTHLDIENISDDNERSLFRSQRIKLRGKVAITPFRAIDPSKIRSDISFNKNALGFNEIYKELDPERISSLQKNSFHLDRFARELRNISSKEQMTDLTLCILKYISRKPNAFPNIKEIEFLTDVTHSYSDFTSIPMVDLRIDDSNFSSYMNYLDLTYDIINEINQKPIMGALPNLPREAYSKLLEFYLNRGITAFYFDFNGQTPDHLKLRPILRYLNKRKVLSQTLIYGINTKSGRALKNANVIPSKDFIAYGFGLDVLGESHVRPRLPKAFFEKMKMAINQQQENKKRIFIKADYGYYQARHDALDQIYPDDTHIPLLKIINDPRNTWQKLFNMEQQALEAGEIRRRLNELKPNETVLDYVKNKTQVTNELKHLESGPKGISSE
jgi:hypothetical protein